jgi:peptide/nickel transport system substrate-binding protein
MKVKPFYLVIAMLVMASMLFAACAPAATPAAPAEPEAPAEPAPAEPEPAPAEPEEPAEPAEPAEPPMAFEPMSVSAGNCDYGGKILDITALDELTVQFNLCKPDPAFLAKAAFIPFGIQPAEYFEQAAGTNLLLEQPIGTGPYRLERWDRGTQITFQRFDDYWGEPAKAATAVLRWNQEGAARLLELQAGTVHMITSVNADDFEVVENDPNLQLLPVPAPNILYLGFTNTFEPWDNPLVRQALAIGVDRQRIVDNFFPPGSEVADYFTPCSIPNGCQGEPWYDFDPERARELLAEAGYENGFSTSIYYRDVYRHYLPEPGLVAVEFQTQLKENLNIDVEVVVMESGEFIAASTDGQLDGLYLLGWSADYPHVTNFLDFHFGAANPQFGDPFPEIYEVLERASQMGDEDEAAVLYEEANNKIRELIPMLPVSHGSPADAALASLGGAYVPPFSSTQLGALEPADGDTVVFMQNNEPISLFCADETDGESLRPCEQVVESLLQYGKDTGDTFPALATACESNEEATVWTCYLREGVLFHDGSTFDANDVVASWAVGIDASNPHHCPSSEGGACVANTGGFDYYAYLWDSLMNLPE